MEHDGNNTSDIIIEKLLSGNLKSSIPVSSLHKRFFIGLFYPLFYQYIRYI